MKIGHSLRRIRREKNIALSEISRKTGIALSTLSRIENGKMAGTLKTHALITKALGVSVGELYSAAEKDAKVLEATSGKKRAELFNYRGKTRYELLAEKIDEKKIMPLMLKLESGGKTRKETNKIGMEKFVFVISGSLEAFVDKNQYLLKSGDSLYFDASVPHHFESRSRRMTEAILAISPPEFRRI